ncbi:MAG: hypothetical protein ABFS42_11865, partial [Candidatus Krumholzibacteriota bacterium]
MTPVLEIVSHPTGPWLVKAGNIMYAVPPRLGRALRPLAGRLPARREIRNCLAEVRRGHELSKPEIDTWVDELGRALAPDPAPAKGRAGLRRVGRPIRLRVPLVPAPVVRRLAGILRVPAGNRGLVFVAALGLAGYVAAGYMAAGSWRVGFSWDLETAAAGLGLFLLTAVWHELGHAAALARSGYPPGGIGAGVLFVIPVLFADVTAMGVLPRAGRIRVDVSGMIFQLGAGGFLMALAAWGGADRAWTPALTLAGSSALLAISWSLFPFLHSDGYWLLCDLLGLESLDRPPAEPAGKGLRLFLVGYQLTNAAFLLMIGVFFPWKMVGLLGGLVQHLGYSLDSATGRWVAVAVGFGFVAMLGVGVAHRVMALIRSARAGILDITAKNAPRGAFGDNKYVVN